MLRLGPIQRIVIAGGGIVGWSAAAALRRRLPHVELTILALPPPADALAERIGATLPSAVEFHRDLGLTEADTLLRAGSGFRLGSCFTGWHEGSPAYVHAYGAYGRPFGTASFHHHWVRAALTGDAAPFDLYSPAAAIARAGRFTPPVEDEPLAGFEYGLALNLPRYLEMMHAFARHLGVREQPGGVAGVELDGEDGFIAALRLDDGSALAADLFVDCTGPAATLRSALDQRFESWSDWLLCDRVRLAEMPPPEAPAPLDQVIATPSGWRFEAPSPVRTSLGSIHASAFADGGETGPGEEIALRQGRRSQPWLRNCVAIGDAAVAVEPLETCNLHLAHSQIDRIVSMMPDRDCAPVELWDYNRQCAAEADRIRDFLVLHYVTSLRPEPFWQAARAVTPPASLAHSLALFADRGRLPLYEEETFSRDAWAAVLLGQGVIPRRIDPLIDTVSPAASALVMADMRAAIEHIVPTLPTQVQYLQGLAGQNKR